MTHYDPIHESEKKTVSEMAEDYGVDRDVPDDADLLDVQVELAEALAQFCPNTFDDTDKRNAVWSILRAMYLIDSFDEAETEFSLEENEEIVDYHGEEMAVLIENVRATRGDRTVKPFIETGE